MPLINMLEERRGRARVDSVRSPNSEPNLFGESLSSTLHELPRGSRQVLEQWELLGGAVWWSVVVCSFSFKLIFPPGGWGAGVWG